MKHLGLFKKVIASPTPRVTLERIPIFLAKGSKPEGALFLDPINGEKVYISNSPQPLEHVRYSAFVKDQTSTPTVTKISALKGKHLTFFLNELNNMTTFSNHPGIISYDHVFQFENKRGKFGAIVMPKYRPFDRNRTPWMFLNNLKSIADTLSFIHHSKRAYNDLKIENLLTADQGRIVFCDLESMRPCNEPAFRRTYYDIASCTGDDTADSLKGKDKRPSDIWAFGMLILDFFLSETYIYFPVMDRDLGRQTEDLSYGLSKPLKRHIMDELIKKKICYLPYKNQDHVLTYRNYDKEQAKTIIRTCIPDNYGESKKDIITEELLEVLDKYIDKRHNYNKDNPIHDWYRNKLPGIRRALMSYSMDDDMVNNEARLALSAIVSRCLKVKPEERPTATALFNHISTAISQIDLRFHEDSGEDSTTDNFADSLPTIPTNRVPNSGCCVIS